MSWIKRECHTPLEIHQMNVPLKHNSKVRKAFNQKAKLSAFGYCTLSAADRLMAYWAFAGGPFLKQKKPVGCLGTSPVTRNRREQLSHRFASGALKVSIGVVSDWPHFPSQIVKYRAQPRAMEQPAAG